MTQQLTDVDVADRWRFPAADLEKAAAFYEEYGFAGFPDLLGPDDLAELRGAFDELLEKGEISYREGEEFLMVNDALYTHPVFERFVSDRRIVEAVETLVGRAVEVQHSKLICKPLQDRGTGVIEWHQDYPFFPHSNFDLLAVGIHLDEETEAEGPVRMIPGSHRDGVRSHVVDGEFANRVAEPPEEEDSDRGMLMTGPAGQVTMHHGLVLHASSPKTSDRQRRILVTQYRAQDAIQLAGVVWRCAGHEVSDNSGEKFARFPDGTEVELRGRGGRLYDLDGKFTPDKQDPAG